MNTTTHLLYENNPKILYMGKIDDRPFYTYKIKGRKIKGRKIKKEEKQTTPTNRRSCVFVN